jgi:hypothetical protein
VSAAIDGLALALQPTNLLALVALGLLAGRHGGIIVFMIGLLIGSLAIASALREPPAALALLAIAATAGVIVATGWSPPLPITVVLLVAGGSALAMNSPPQATAIAFAIASQIATGVGAVVIVAGIALIASAANRAWQHVALRIVGSWIAASAILVLALRFVR